VWTEKSERKGGRFDAVDPAEMGTVTSSRPRQFVSNDGRGRIAKIARANS
jgi:hypothetical protein